jgi:hypothetical protein
MESYQIYHYLKNPLKGVMNSDFIATFVYMSDLLIVFAILKWVNILICVNSDDFIVPQNITKYLIIKKLWN